MRYRSTRGASQTWSLMEGFLLGLAPDGGLLVPEHFPRVDEQTLRTWSRYSFAQLCDAIFRLFGLDLDDRVWQRIVADTVAAFDHPEVTPVTQLDDRTAMLELFHGPTYAFKDVALQLMGQLYAHASAHMGARICILGATSGDTGAAAIAGVRGHDAMRICILHPHEKVSRVQRLQMTTVIEENILNLAVRGTFDDCQRIIKDVFRDAQMKQQYALRAVNSINIVRIIAQMVYYAYAFFRVPQPRFVVPTGNFGNALSAFWLRCIGVPIGDIVVATNENDVLATFFREGVYATRTFKTTPSPSMDIQVASNFERYVYHVLDGDGDAIARMMRTFAEDHSLVFDANVRARMAKDFCADAISNARTLHTIEDTYRTRGVLIDPHTACAVAAARAAPIDGHTVVVATAHPAKFGESIEHICPNQPIPERIAALDRLPVSMCVVEATTEAVVREIVSFFSR